MSATGESQTADIFLKPVGPRARVVYTTIIFVVAFGIRLLGMGWGLPNEMRHQSLHPDEPLNLGVWNYGQWFTPGFYNYGTLYFTTAKVAGEMGKSYGWVPVGETAATWQTEGSLTLTARVISSLAGAATIAIVFALLLSLSNLLGALVGGFAFLVAPAHVVHSRFATPDVFATMFIALGALLIWRLMTVSEDRRVRVALWLGLVIGFAAGTKYTGGLLILSAWLAAWSLDKVAFWRLGGAILGGTIVGFFVATPGAVLQFAEFTKDFLYELSHSAEGHGLVFANTPTGFAYHFVNLVTAFGLIALVLSLIGLALAVHKRERWALPFLLFCVAYYVLIGRAEVKFLRYVFPLLPFLAIGFGYLIGRLHEMGRYWRIVNIFAILAVGFSVRAENGVVRLTALMMLEDPRDMAAKWINENAGDQRVGYVNDPWFWSPPLFPDTGLPGANNRLRAMFEENPRLVRYIAPDGSRKEWDARLVTELRPDWITFSSFEFYDHDRVSQPDFVECFARLKESYDLVAIAWGGVVISSDEGDAVDRDSIRQIIMRNYPLMHDMMYIQPTVCVLRSKATK